MVDEEFDQLTHRLGERVKELTALHDVARVIQSGKRSTPEVLEALLPILQVAWQYPEVTAVRVRYGTTERATGNFRPTPWRQEASFRTTDGQDGLIEVVYLEERPEDAEGPFIPEERNLINSLASVLETHFERRQVEEALRASEARFRAIFSRAAIGITLADMERRIVEANPAFQAMLGYSSRELRHMSYPDFIHPDDATADLALYSELVSGRRDRFLIEERYIRKDGRTVWGRRVVSLVRTAEGEPQFTISMVEDITERKRTEEALQESEERFRATYAAVGQTALSLDGKFLKANRAFCEMTGYDGAELQDRDFQSIIHPGDHASRLEYIQRILGGEAPSRPLEQRYFRKGGGLATALVSISVVRDAEGAPEYLITLIQDITERKRAEQRLSAQYAVSRALGESQAMGDAAPRVLQAIGDSMDWGLGFLWSVDHHTGRLRCTAAWHGPSVNADAFETVSLGTSFRPGIGLPGRVWADGEPIWIADVLQERNFPRLQTAAEADVHGAFAFPVLSGNETLSVVEFFSQHIQPPDEDLIRTVTALGSQIGQFIERKRAEEELAERAEQLERSNRELAQFAYVASHDLQEPLRMVSSYTQLLARRYRNKLDDDGQEFISYAVDGAARMQGLINDLLVYSRVDTRGKPFESTGCNAVLDRVLTNLQLAIEETGTVITHDPLPTIRADVGQLVQLFQNLIGNAIKFRRDEQPRVHVSAMRSGSHWVFSVKDNGIGIEPQYAEQVFVIFQRLHTRGEYPGTGLGLAICKKIVERHGGRIWVESEPGKGTTFFFTIPVEQE